MVQGILVPLGKRIMTRVVTNFIDILYDRGWYWELDGGHYSTYQLKKIIARPADKHADTLTIVEKGRFISLLNFEDFNTYSVIEGLTDMPDGTHEELPRVKMIPKSELLYVKKGVKRKFKNDRLVPGITDTYVDPYNRIFGMWEVASHLGDDEDIVEIIYNRYQQIAYYLIYKADRTIVLSPIASFEIIHPLGPKIIDFVKEGIITEQGYDGFKLWLEVNRITNYINKMIDIINGELDIAEYLDVEENEVSDELEEKIRKTADRMLDRFKEKAEIIPISNSTKYETGNYKIATFMDGTEPVYASPFGFYAGDPSTFEPEKAVRELENLITPNEYASGDFEFKLFDDYTYAIRYKNYIALPCCLVKLNDELSILDYNDSRDIAYKICQTGYKYATKPVENYTTEMRFDVPNFLE